MDSSGELFFKNQQNLIEKINSLKFEPEFVPTMKYENFLKLQLEVRPIGLPEHLMYPYCDTGWSNSLIPNPDLAKFKYNYHSMEILAKIYNNDLDLKMKVVQDLWEKKLLLTKDPLESHYDD